MQGPQDYLLRNRDEVAAALAARDLAPRMFWRSAERMAEVADGDAHLVVTSPPYPLIEMWDESLAAQTGLPREELASPKGFEASHALLARVWAECHRALAPGGILAVNVGDATRAVAGDFQCAMNHVRVTEDCQRLGFQSLVPILWKKPTNKPTAFLGSGFLPPNAYVTLDCEFILLFRKGGARQFPPKDPLRYASQFSKAERDAWFTQVWEVRGAPQDKAGTAPFPPEIPYRLVRMFSCLGDTVLDPFAGSGVTLQVARSLGRRAVGYEVNHALRPFVEARLPPHAPSPEEVLRGLEALYASTGGAPTRPGLAPSLLGEERARAD